MMRETTDTRFQRQYDAVQRQAYVKKLEKEYKARNKLRYFLNGMVQNDETDNLMTSEKTGSDT